MTGDPSQHKTVALDPKAALPRVFGRYVLVRQLGGGGMGTVYLAEDRELQRQVALKLPHADLLRRTDVRERFLHEGRAAARLEHPNFCPVYDVGEVNGQPYLSMRYVPGRPLGEAAPREPRAIAHLIRTLARALAHAHARGVIHRDLKPANVLLDEQGTPVITDFGLAVRTDSDDRRLTSPGAIVGTPYYMAPEQIRPDLSPVGPWTDVYSLGVILYELLAGQVPFPDSTTAGLVQVVTEDPPPPSQRRPDVDRALEAICLKALARSVADRYPDMNAFADDLAHYLGIADQATPWVPLSTPAGSPPGPAGGLLDPGCVRFHFAGYGEQLPTAPQNRLFLDVGNALRPGVLDHHHLGGAHGSTASLVLHRPDLVRAALNPARGPGEAFTVVLHEQPDLDGVVSAYLALELLTRGTFPPGSEALARYVDKVDEGSLGMSLANPYSLYAGYYQLNNRLGRQRWNAPQEHWREAVRLGLVLAGFIVGEMDSKGLPLPEVDAFGCPELFGPEDREEVQADVRRYEAKLREPATKARRAVLRLPGQFGGKVEVESLRVRDVQNLGDPERVIFFKDWARSDTRHSRLGRGFAALSVFHSEGSGHVRRCILSVRPDSGATLRGLGDLLDEAESARRQEVHGVDDRVQDPVTGQSRTPRPGYANADPWYDGRAHDYTIIDSPRSGTLLTAGEVEGIFLRFGEG